MISARAPWEETPIGEDLARVDLAYAGYRRSGGLECSGEGCDTILSFHRYRRGYRLCWRCEESASTDAGEGLPEEVVEAEEAGLCPSVRLDNLGRARTLLGMAQWQLARAAGLSRDTIHRIEVGHPCRLSTARILAAEMDMPLQELCPEIPATTKEER